MINHQNEVRFFIQKLPELVEDIQNKRFGDIINDSDNLEGEGIEKNIIPSNIIVLYTRLETLIGINISGHTNTLTEASNLIDQLYRIVEIQNEHQYRNALHKFSTQEMELPGKN